MDKIQIVKAYYAALDSDDMDQVDQYLSEDYQLIDFTAHPMGKHEMLDLVRLFKSAFTKFDHSLSNIRVEEQLVKLTVQLSGWNNADLDLRGMKIGIVPSAERFIIFPNEFFEIIFRGEKISVERDVSPNSPNRRMGGMLKALGVNIAAY